MHDLPIPDLYIRSLEPERSAGLTRWTALKDVDHLLRRFGLAEVVRLTPERPLDLRVRNVADEVWALIEGVAEFRWLDRRPGSHTKGVRHRLRAEVPHVVLAPFGVAFGVQALQGPALLLRLATHADDDPDSETDLTLAWESEA